MRIYSSTLSRNESQLNNSGLLSIIKVKHNQPMESEILPQRTAESCSKVLYLTLSTLLKAKFKKMYDLRVEALYI